MAKIGIKKEQAHNPKHAASTIKTGPDFFSDSELTTSKSTPKKKTASIKAAKEKSIDGVTMKKEPVKSKKTKIVVKFNCGVQNNLFIRGNGITSLSWMKGEPLQNVGPDEWIWETERPCTKMEFKILLNDQQFEIGENHTIPYGGIALITPNF